MAYQLAGVEVAAFMHGAGFSGETLVTMIAIAKAESDWRPDSNNGSTTATGLLQIMYSVWKDDPGVKALGVNRRSDLHDPGVNCKVGLIVFQKQGLKAWSTYSSGKYKKYVDDANQAVRTLQDRNHGPAWERRNNKNSDVGLGGAVHGVDDAVQSVQATGIDGLTAKLGSLAANGGVLVLGIAMLGLGVMILAKQNAGVRKAAKALPVVGAVL